MFAFYADKNRLTLRQREPLTSGSVNVYSARFEFSEDWDGLEKIAVFRGGGEAVNVLPDASGVCQIPWEVLTKPGVRLRAGVYGTRGGEVVLPTVWADCGAILEGASPGEAARPPTPDLWRQELARKGDKLEYTPDGDLGLYAGEDLLSAVPVSGGGGGTSDHRLLSGREAEDQHPISAIAGLSDQLERIPEPVEPLTNEDLEAILK